VIDGMVTHRFKNYATDEVDYAEVFGPEFVHLVAQHILPPRLARIRYSAMFRSQGRVPRLEVSQHLINQAGLAPRGNACFLSASRLLGEEYDEDREESEEETSPRRTVSADWPRRSMPSGTGSWKKHECDDAVRVEIKRLQWRADVPN
jgi:hypothetical protein